MKHVLPAALAALGLAASAQAQDGAQAWRSETLGGPAGWVMLQQGDPFAEPEMSAVRIRYERNPLGFMYGCDRGRYLSVSWHPSRPLQAAPGSNVPVAFSINGATAATGVMQPNNDGILVMVEAKGAAARLIEGIDAARKGVIGISAGGLSDSVPFDETRNGGTAEYVLNACAT